MYVMKTFCASIMVIVLLAACKKDDESIPTPPPGPPSPVDTLLNWKKVSVTQTQLVDVWFTSKQVGVILAEGGIYRTANEGAAFAKVANGGYANLFFLNAQYGYAQGGDFAYTTDGGVTWVVRTNSVVDYNDLFFTTPSTGYATSANALYKTTDTGKTWQNVRAGECTGLFFFDSNNGWVQALGKLYKTTNGGSTWTLVSDIGAQGFFGMLQFTDATHAKFSNGHTFARSNDGGVTWSKLIFNEEIYDLHFLTNDIGYLLTPPEIFKTTDGGATWTRSTKIAGRGLVELHFTDANNGWACGNAVQLLNLKQ